MDVKKTNAWKTAEREYEEINAHSTVPFLDAQLSPDEIIKRLERIRKKCPRFYPALFELGLRKLATGGNGQATRMIDEGFTLMLELTHPKHLNKDIDALMENLEKLWRFDLSEHYLGIFVDLYPENVLYKNQLAFAAARMGHIDTALLHVSRAIEIEPDNSGYRSNEGLIHLIAGNLKEAGDALTKALGIDPENKAAKRNLEIHGYLTEHGGNYLDYLLRPAEREEIDRLADEEEWEQFEELCRLCNESRIEAIAQTLLQEDDDKRSRLLGLLCTLEVFFGFVHQIDQSGHLLHEDIAFIRENFKPIMHKFIFKFGDVDRKRIEDIYEYLFEYYGFLANRGIVSVQDFKDFQKHIKGLKNEVIDKMERYNAIRHNDGMSNEEKEDIREELFDGDHAWPFL